MIKKGLIAEIYEWIGGLEYWEQYLAIKVLNQSGISDKEIEIIFKLFLEDSGLAKKEIEREKIVIQSPKVVESAASDFNMTEIKDIAGVNALQENQSIPISKNLTIIYGDNGAGKSGYIRIMNNAFLSRGDKAIIPNIYSSATPKNPSCTFKFMREGAEYELKYPEDESKHEFSCYSVFDTLSVNAHLNSEAEIQFLPSGLTFFDAFAQRVEKIKALLTDACIKSSPENSFIIYFDKDTTIKKLIEELSASTDIKVIQEKATLSSEEIKNLDLLEKALLDLQKTDVTKKVKSLKDTKTQLIGFKNSITDLNKLFSDSSIKAYKKLLEDFNFNKELSVKEGMEQFKTGALSNTGSPEWKKLLTAAKEFAQIQHEDEAAYPQEKDVCILCHQPLTKEAKTLLETYWTYLSSTAEKELKKFTTEIDEKLTELKELKLDILVEDSLLYTWLSENAGVELKNWITQLKVIEGLKKELNGAFKGRKWNEEIKNSQVSITPIANIEKSIDGKIATLNEADINKKIKTTQKEIDELKDRKKLTQLLPKIEEFISKHKWSQRAQKKSFTTRKITSMQKDLFTRYVTEEYITLFNEECKKLDATFGIEITQRSQKGNTLKHLVLKGKSPGSILSEGEQRAISLADFLAEVQMGNQNKGIVFDDPVNSLDHKRRQIIAERLIEESKNRQVIVFTHDVTFLLALQALSEEKNTGHSITTIRKIQNTPGIVNHAIPWPALNVNARVKKLNEMLQELKKTEKATDVDKYYFDAKAWSGLLRETWERSIEEKLFNDAIQRFSPAIQTKRLEKAKFTPELYKEVEKGMGDCSDWAHDQARAINSSAPDTTKLELFLSEFVTFAKKCSN